MQHDAAARIGDAGAEDAVQAEDERRGVSIRIDSGDVDRIARELAPGNLVPRQRARRVDELASLGRIGFRDEPRHRHLAVARVGKPAVAIVVGELLRLHEQVHVVGALVGAELEGLDEVQHLEHREALRRRRRLINGHPAVGAGDGLAPVGALRSEIRATEETAVLGREAGERAGDLAFVEASAALSGDRFERARERRIGELGATAEE